MTDSIPWTFHLVLTGKGGVGKSLVAALLAQHLRAHEGGDVVCFDADPVNATFSGYRAFNTVRVELLDNGRIDPGRLDPMIVRISEEPKHHLADTGAGGYPDQLKYFVESDALGVLSRMGRKVVIHIVITGGPALRHGLDDFEWQAQNFSSDIGICVWLNGYFGPVEAEGKAFRQMRVYERNRDRIAAIFHLPRVPEHTFGRDLRAMLDQRLTFAEAKVSPAFSIIQRQRLAMLEHQFLDQLSALP